MFVRIQMIICLSTFISLLGYPLPYSGHTSRSFEPLMCLYSPLAPLTLLPWRGASVVKSLVDITEKDLQHVLGIERALLRIVRYYIHDILSIRNISVSTTQGST
jgi:hypothetical protein